MLVNTDQRVTQNAALFIAQHTEHCSPQKLTQLLFLLDVQHFGQTARPVTPFDYVAGPSGPASAQLASALLSTADYFGAVIQVVDDKVVPTAVFDDEHMTPRKLRLLAELCTQYHAHTDTALAQVLMATGSVWDLVYQQGAGQDAPIPYAMTLIGNPHRAALLEMAEERRRFVCANEPSAR